MSFILARWPNFLMAHNQQNHEYSYQRTLQYSIIIVSDSVQIRSRGFYFFILFLFFQFRDDNGADIDWIYSVLYSDPQ